MLFAIFRFKMQKLLFYLCNVPQKLNSKFDRTQATFGENFWRQCFSLKLSVAEENGLCLAAKHHFCLNADTGSKEQNRRDTKYFDLKMFQWQV